MGEKYSDYIDVELYKAGKDFSYIKKYGMIMKGTLIINESKKYDSLSKSKIEEIILNAIKENS